MGRTACTEPQCLYKGDLYLYLYLTTLHLLMWFLYIFLIGKLNIYLYASFWVIPRRLNFICRRFGALCLFHLHRRVGMKNGWV